jgi:molecular chaperone HtpG
MMLMGAIDSPDIPLNVSRSYLQTDRTVRQVATHIAKKVCDRLSGLYKTDREKFLQTWPDLELIVKLGCMQDDKFYEKAKDFLVWKNSAGEWTTLEDYQSRNKEALGDKIFYAGHEKQQSAFLEVYKKKGIEVLHTNPMIDTHLLAFLEQKLAPSTFQRIDAAVEDVILDKEREKVVLDESGRSAAAVTADWVRQALESKNIEVEAKSLASEELPAFLMIDEQGRRMRDFMRQNSPDMGTEMLEGMTKRTLVVNTNSPLIDATEKLGQAEPELAKEVMQQVYELALLSQRELEPEQLPQVIGRSQSVLQDLVQRASK